MKWTWFILFAVTVGAGIIILRSCPKQTEAPSPTPSSAPSAIAVPEETTSALDQAKGNGPLSSKDSGVPKPPELNNNPYPTPSSAPNYSPIPNYQPPTYQPPPYNNDQGFDPNSVPPPPPPPPPGGYEGDFDGGVNVPPPAFEPPEEMGDPNMGQPYNPED